MNQVRRFVPGVIKAIESKAVAAVSKAYEANLNPYINNLEALWSETLLPEIKGYLARWEAFDPDGASMPDLLAHLDQVLAQAERIGTVHFLIFGPYIFAMSQFEELYRDLFDGDHSNGSDAFAACRLLQGFDNMILAGDRMLWHLSRKALTMPAVQEILENEAAADVIPALQRSAAGQVFLSEFDAFLREHGQRGAMYSPIGEVSWLENPTPVVKMLKDYITQPDRDLEAEMAAEAAERERLVRKARKQLSGYPRPVVDEFERLLKAAQVGTVLHSDHAYWAEYRAMYEVRRVLLTLGRRLASASVIDAPTDVFFLWLAELKEAANDPERSRMQELVDERRSEIAHFGAIKAPAMLGTTPLLSPSPDDPLRRLIAKTSGATVSGGNGADPTTLRGNAGSPGTVCDRRELSAPWLRLGKCSPGTSWWPKRRHRPGHLYLLRWLGW